MERRWYLGVAALLLLVVAVIVFLLLPVREPEPVPAEKPPPAGADVRPIGGALTPPRPSSLAPDAATAAGVTIQSASDPDPLGGGTATVIGRVLLDGKPLTAYSVVFSKHLDVGMWANPREVRSSAGTFAFEKLEAGTWNVFVGAPGIARRSVVAKLVAGEVADLGDIEVDSGLRITGTVVDGSSRPIAGATVKLAGTGMSGFTVTAADTGEVLSAPTAQTEALRGRQSAVTDARGHYQLDGVIPDVGERRLWIEASHPTHGSSPRTNLPDEDGTINFVLGGTGALDGKITVPLAGPVSIIARRIDGLEQATEAKTDAEGQFRFEALYPGTYLVTVRGHDRTTLPAWRPREVVVASGKRASLTLAEPRVTVTLEGTATKMCRALDLRARTTDSFANSIMTASCSDTSARFERVEPGHFVICRMRDCIDVDAAASPAVQRFDATELVR